MAVPTCLVTGSSGLVGSAVCSYLSTRGCEVHGVDSNQRAVFFGPAGDTRWNLQRLRRTLRNFHHHAIDVRDRQGVADLVATVRPALIVHAAGQPSHDRAAAIPFDDFETNAVGTLNLLEAARAHCKESPFVFMSTNKVYGDLPNTIPLAELPTRWDYSDPAFAARRARDVVGRSVDALAVRGLEAGGRRAGAGVRTLFRDADLLPARRLRHRPEPRRRRAARVPQLPGEMQPGVARVPRLRLQGKAGPRQHPRRGRRRVRLRVLEDAASRRGLQPRRRQGEFVLDSRGVRSRGLHHPSSAGPFLRRRSAARRPHLLLQRPAEDPCALSGLGHHQIVDDTVREIVETWSARSLA